MLCRNEVTSQAQRESAKKKIKKKILVCVGLRLHRVGTTSVNPTLNEINNNNNNSLHRLQGLGGVLEGVSLELLQVALRVGRDAGGRGGHRAGPLGTLRQNTHR